MKKNSWKIRALALTLLAVCWLSGCSAHKKISVTAAETQEETRELSLNTETEAETQPEAEPEERCEKDGKIQSYLTGEWTDVAKANRRPLAIMMSNDKAALPQYGINHAGVVYEAPVEGSMNRYMALIEDYDDLDRIGSVRSCRPYYTFFAREFEAVYAHYGQNTFALPYLEQMEHLDGIKGNGASAYFRTKDRKTPHNAYASGPKLRQAIEASGYADVYPESYEGHYTFAPESAPVCFEDGIAAAKVVPGYQLSNPWFEYHPEDGLYYRYQYGGPHMGDEGQIAVKNIIFQYCLWKYYKPTEYLNIDVHTPAMGYYFTNGHGILIRWEKDGAYGVTKYYDMDGQEIKLNPGKTWVCILPNDRMDKAEFYGEQTE